MTNRTIKAILEVDSGRYIAGMSAAARATRDFASQATTGMRDSRDAWDSVGNTALVAGGALAGGLGLATKAAISWESAWAGVTKTVDGTPEQYAALESELRGLAKTLPATHEEIAGVAEAAGQLGIARQDIADFTETAIALGESTNLSAEEAATGLAKIANVMGTFDEHGVEGIDRMGAALVALGNDGASTEADILAMSQRIAGAADQIGASEADVLALSNALSSVGIEADLGGGAISRALLKINSAVIEGGKSLNDFSKVAGMSATEFAQAWRDDPIAAANEFIGGLGRVSEQGGDAAATLDKLGLGGTQNAQVLLRAASASDLLADSLALGATAWDENSALAEEAGKRYETTEARLQTARNTMKDAAIDIGAAFGPVIADTAEGVASLVNTFSGLPQPVQNVATGLAGLTASAALLAGGTIKVVGWGQSLSDALDQIGVKGPKTEKALSGIGKAAKVAGGALATFATLAAAGHAAGLGDDFLGGISDTDLARGMLANADGIDAINAAIRESADYRVLGVDAVSQIQSFDDVLTATFSPQKGQQVEAFFGGLGAAVGFTNDSDLAVAARRFEEIDASLVKLAQSGNADAAASQFDSMEAAAARLGISTEQLKTMLPGYADLLSSTALQSESAAAQSDGLAGALDETGASADGAAADVDSLSDAITGLGDAMLGQRGSARDYQAALDDMAAAIAENGRTLDITTEAGRANEEALDGIAEATQEWAATTLKATGSTEQAAAILDQGRGRYVAFAKQLGMTTSEANRLADKLFELDAIHAEPTVTEKGATESSGRVRTFRNDVLALKDRQISVTESGAAQSTATVQRLQNARDRLQSKMVRVGVTTTGEDALRNLQYLINGMSGRNINVNTYMTTYRNTVDMGVYKSRAFGGVEEHRPVAMAGGGMLGPGALRPGIYGTSKAGILMAEDTRSAWEAYIPERRDIRHRSEAILEDVAARFGKRVVPMADGGIAARQYVRWQASGPGPASGSPASPAPSIDYDRLAAVFRSSLAGVKVTTNIGGREFHGLISETERMWGGR